MSSNPIHDSPPLRRISGSSKDIETMNISSVNTMSLSQLKLDHGKTNVYLKIDCNITEVLEVDQKFITDFNAIEAWYVEPSKEDAKYSAEICNLTIDEDKPKWVPDLTFFNGESELVSEQEYYRYKNIFFKYLNMKVTTNEVLELERFPFDRQVLHIKFDSQNSNILPMPDDLHALTKNYGKAYKNIFRVRTIVTKYKLDNAEIVIDDATNQCLISVMFTREPMFYITNVVCVMFTIVIITISVYGILTYSHSLTQLLNYLLTPIGIPVDEYGSKLSITVTALLTAVAFKLVANGFCPPVSYLTLLDKYILLAFATLLVIVAENFIVSQMDYDKAVTLDQAFSIVILLWWLLLHVCIAIGTKYNLFYQDWKDVIDSDTPEQRVTRDYYTRKPLTTN